MLYDTGKLRAELSIKEVCECLGIACSGHGKNTFIACPEHSERRHDNCVITDKNMYYCFACGAKGDIFDLIMQSQGVDFATAAKIASEMTGCPERYLTGSKKVAYKATVISDDDCKFLGIKNRPVYHVANISDSHPDRSEDYTTIDEGDSNYEYAYVNLRQAIPNPLRYLMETNKDAYNALVCGKAYEKIEIYRQIGQSLNVDVQSYIDRAVKLVIEHGGNIEVQRSCFLADNAEQSGSTLF